MARQTNTRLREKVIYSVFVRNHTKEGTFQALEGDLDRLAALGTDIIWLMPIHPIGEAGRKGTLGSPYAIRDFRGINPEYGTLGDFMHLVGEIHKRGMKCIIDVVYNHTSPDSILATGHPEFFLRDEAGNPTRKVADWSDVVDLDYSNRELWKYQIETLKIWAEMADTMRQYLNDHELLDYERPLLAGGTGAGGAGAPRLHLAGRERPCRPHDGHAPGGLLLRRRHGAV